MTLIPGDGIGPEVIDATCRALEATGVEFDWDVEQVGQPALDAVGTPLPDSVAESVIANRVALKGPVTRPPLQGLSQRQHRHAQGEQPVRQRPPLPHLPGRSAAATRTFNVVVIRDVTEDLYAGVEAQAGTPEAAELIASIEKTTGRPIAPGSGISIKAIWRRPAGGSPSTPSGTRSTTTARA